MFRHNIPNIKVNQIRKLYIENPNFNRSKAAVSLGVSRTSILVYATEFKTIQEYYPEKLKDFSFFLPVVVPGRPKKAYYLELCEALPSLLATQTGPRLKAAQIWREYRQLFPDGYSYSPFKQHFFKWCSDNEISPVSTKHIEHISEEDLATLKKWRLSNDRQHWQIAVVIDAARNRKSMLKTMEKVECTYPTISRWLKIFEKEGLEGFKRSYIVNERIAKNMKAKMDNLIDLVRHTPQIYGLPRTGWTTEDLSAIYEKEYSVPMSHASVSRYLRKQGISLRRAKQVLTSPDPLYREKFAVIQQILENLSENDKFFPIDEMGPCAVKPKGGRQWVVPGQRPIYPQVIKSKGWFICTAALELSTNQVTHFYSRKKDTEEMIKMIDLLAEKYHDQERLFISWDAVSWHNSKKLISHINGINNTLQEKRNRPIVQLAPLPASAQFLNVIESVFSGLSKSVIHNSDYESLEACIGAIDNYFAKRNNYFLLNPKRAGNKIWGKESVKPVFDKANKCKAPGKWDTGPREENDAKKTEFGQP